MRPLITIGIASYNYENYIGKALSAIKRQKFQDIEVLISDDCSKDNSVKVIQKFMEDNPQMTIRLITNTQNQGLVANKNILIKNCYGEYLMLCDADDWMADDCLEKIAEMLYREKPDRIISAFSNIDESGKIIQVQNIPENQTKWGWNVHHGSVYKVDLLRKYNITIKDEPDDVYFTVEYAKYCKTVISINEPIYFWLVHLDSEGRKRKKDFSTECLKYIRELNFVGDNIEILKKGVEYTGRDVEELRMVLLKIYYFNIFFAMQQLPLKEKLYYYDIFHNEIKKIDADYLKNELLGFKEAPIFRSYASKSIKVFATVEKIKLMKIALVCFHIISKFKYFDQ